MSVFPGTVLTNAIPTGFDGSRYLRVRREDGVPLPGKYTVEDYEHQIRAFLEYRRPWTERWIALENIYDNPPRSTSYHTDGVHESERLGRGYGLVHAIASSLYNSTPKIFVNALLAAAEDEAPVWEALLNNDWTLIGDQETEVGNMLTDMAIYSFGVALTTYEADFEAVLKVKEKRDKAVEQAIADGTIDGRVANILDELQQSTHAPESELTHEWDERILEERVSTRRLSPWYYLWDWRAARHENVRWEAEAWWLPLEDVKAGPFENTEDLQPNGDHDHCDMWPEKYRRSTNTSLSAGTRDIREWVMGYNIWDYRSNKLVTISPGHPKPLREREIPYHCRPFQFASWAQRGEGLITKGDLGMVYNQLCEEEHTRNKLQDAFAREAVDVYLIDKNSGIGEEGIEPWVGPDNAFYIKVDGSRVPVQQQIAKVPREAKSPDILNYLFVIRDDIQETVGIGANQRGAALKSDTSATEAGNIQQNMQVRAGYKFRAVEKLVRDIAKCRMSLYAQFYDEEKILHLVGPEAAAQWAARTFTKGDIQNRFAVSVEPGSTASTNDVNRQLTFERIFRMAITLPGAAQMVNVPEIFREWLKTLGILDGSRLLQIQDPQQASALLTTLTQNTAGGGAGGGNQGVAPDDASLNQANLGNLGGI